MEKKAAPVKREVSAKRPSTAVQPARAGKKMVEEDEVAILPTNKAKRQAADQRNKFPLQEVRGDHIEKLQQHCIDAFGLKFHD